MSNQVSKIGLLGVLVLGLIGGYVSYSLYWNKHEFSIGGDITMRYPVGMTFRRHSTNIFSVTGGNATMTACRLKMNENTPKDWNCQGQWSPKLVADFLAKKNPLVAEALSGYKGKTDNLTCLKEKYTVMKHGGKPDKMNMNYLSMPFKAPGNRSAEVCMAFFQNKKKKQAIFVVFIDKREGTNEPGEDFKKMKKAFAHLTCTSGSGWRDVTMLVCDEAEQRLKTYFKDTVFEQ